MKSTFRESTLPATNRPPSPRLEGPAPRGSHFGPPPNAPFEFYLSSAWQGLLWFLPLARIWFDLVQLKPDNKTPLYEVYLLSWILLPLVGIQLTRLLERFRPEELSPALYHRIFVFLNFILVLAAYWDIQTSVPEPLIFDVVIYALAQAAGVYATRRPRPLPSTLQKWTSWLYPAMAALFLLWIPLVDVQWERCFHPGPLSCLLFIALAASVFFEINPRKRFAFKIGFLPYAVLGPFFAFLFINPNCSYCLFNHAYFVGPLADFVNGKTLLVDINAQYGVLLFFFLKLIFPSILPLGFHSFYFLDAVLRLCGYLIFFWIARELFKSWLYPTICTVVLILLNCQTPPSPLWYPSQGVLRFGFIYILAALVMLRDLHPRKAVWFLWLEAITAATAAFWSFEVCFYTVPPYLLFNAVEIFQSGGSPRDLIRHFIRRLIPLAAASLFILAFLETFTWLRAGQLPHWNYYFDFVRLYREGFMMIDTPLVGLWWIPVGVLYLSCFLLLAIRGKKPPHWNLLVLVLF
jgi:hypothetical protein